jgi:acyl-CoA thioester hydrolase
MTGKTGLIAEARLRVRYAETDQMGVAYYGNYLTWFEVGRVEWCKAAGFNYRDMEREDGALLVVAEAKCRYRMPARFDDELGIRTFLLKARSKLVIFGYEVLNIETGGLLATGETTHLFTGPDLKSRALPEKYKVMFGL